LLGGTDKLHVLSSTNNEKMTQTTTQDKAKAAIKKMKSFDINKLNTIANKYNSSLAAVTFWYNAIHN